MRMEQKTFTVEYRMFDVGERVRPSSPRCPLRSGIYVVSRCLAPMFAGEEATVFVEGREHGVSAQYLMAADET